MNIGTVNLDEPRICLCVKAGSEVKGAEHADLFEIRIDYSVNKNPGFLAQEIEKLKNKRKPVILTNRSRSEGGFFQGTEEERLALMTSLLELVDCIDIELNAVREAEELIKKAKDLGKKVIVSHHDFEKTPSKDEVKKILMEEQEHGDIAKAAFKVNNPEDILKIYAGTLDVNSKDKPVIVIPMGDPLARLAGVLFNIPLLYAGNLAPGQLSPEEVKTILKMCGK